jgi:phosphoserine aminotransferase
MLCVEDYLDALAWVKDLGGIEATIARARANAAVLYDWISHTPWVAPLAVDPLTRSQTSVAMRFVEPALIAGGEAAALRLMHELVRLLESEDAAYDVGAYRGMPAGLRIWCGTTIETADILALLPWLEWAYAKARRTSRLEV